MLKKIFVILLLASFVGFSDIHLTYPVQADFSETSRSDYAQHINYYSEHFLGQVGKGQSLELTFNRLAGYNFNWTGVEVQVPAGWAYNKTEGSLYFTVVINVPSGVIDGDYISQFTFSNNLELKTAEVLPLKFKVASQIFDFNFPARIVMNAGESRIFNLTVKSNSIASSDLILGDFEGLPAKWSRSGTIHMNPLESKDVSITVSPIDEGFYNLNLKLTTTAGGVAGDQKVGLRVYPTISSKFKSFGEGFSIVPIILQPFYSLLSWLGF